MKRYLGVDLHRTQFTVCTRLENGRTYLRQWRIEELKLFAAQLKKEDELAVESTGNTRLFHDAVVDHVAHVAVVNPSQFKVISQSVKKTDKNAAELLALYLAKGLLPEVRMKERKQREMSHLAQTRDLLVKQRSALKAKINNLLSAEGINLKREALSSNKALDRVLVGQIRALNQSIQELEGLIEEEGPSLAGHRNLMSIKGIGPVSAAVLLSVIGDIRDFADPGKLAAYLGLVPGSRTPTRRNTPDASPNRATNSRAPAWCNARSLPGASVPSSRTSTNASSAGAEVARPTSPWHANSWESSTTPSKTTGCSRISPILSWPPENRLKPNNE